MPPRALWKGSISFGLVTLPINLVSATEASEALAFNLLHRKDKSRIIEKRFCKKEDVEIPWKDIVKGYQYAKDQYVVITDEDFEKVRVPGTQRTVPFDRVPCTGVGMSRLGTSNAISIGAYTFALQQIAGS